MKALPLLALGAALALSAAKADAQRLLGDIHVAPPPPGPGGHMHHGHGFGFPGFYVLEREVVYERELVPEEKPADPPPPPPPAPRERYVLGRTYASLPGKCMKLIDGGAAYYLCSGDWYRQVGSGSGALYKAVAGPL